jgi:hypothetical protein
MTSLTRVRAILLLTVFAVIAKSGPLFAADEVSGQFKGDGKDAKLAFVSAHKGDTLSDKPTFVIVMSERDHSKDKKPEIKAGFGHYGSALIVTVHPDGKIVGFEVAHTAHQKGMFNSLGNVTISDFKMADGKIQGRIATDGEVTTFGQKWQVNVKFNTKVQ